MSHTRSKISRWELTRALESKKRTLCSVLIAETMRGGWSLSFLSAHSRDYEGGIDDFLLFSFVGALMVADRQ